MKKILSILVIIILVSSVSFAINEEAPIAKTDVIGSVIDKNTGEALAGVKVVLNEINETVYTDFEGNFEFKKVTTGKYTIKAELISYDNKTVTVDLAESNSIKIEVNN